MDGGYFWNVDYILYLCVHYMCVLFIFSKFIEFHIQCTRFNIPTLDINKNFKT